MLLSVKSSQLIHIRKCASSKEAWKKLEDIHQPSGPARKVTLFKQLLSLKMADSDSISNHLNKFFEISEKLLEINIKMQDELLVIILLSSLPKEYENFIVAIESRDSLPTICSMKTKLLEEGKRREGNSVDANESAFFTRHQSQTIRQEQR